MTYRQVSQRFRKEATATPEAVEAQVQPTRPRGLASPSMKQLKEAPQLQEAASPGQFINNNMRQLIAARERMRQRLMEESTKKEEPAVKEPTRGTRPTSDVEPIQDHTSSPTPQPTRTPTGPRRGIVAPRESSSAEGHPFISMIDRTEGGGDYNALLGFSNRNHFRDIQVTNMTLSEIDQFSRTTYGAWSRDWKRRNNHGDASVASTPMGRYQFVNTTLQSVARQMGLSPQTKFTPEVQDKMFDFYLRSRLARAETPEQKRSQLRNAWEGFRHVSDRELDTAISQLT